MDLLVLGGTAFLGRHVTTAALERGHVVTHLNRGRTDPDAFPQVTTVVADREAGERALADVKERTWDAVIDTCGYVPRVVGASARALAPRTGLYAFVSSISAYADLSVPGVDEEGPLSQLDDPASEELPAQYGPLKAACERVVQQAYGERALVVRPGLLVGPHDPTDRFTYWPVRLARGGNVLAPAPPEQPAQWIDARDLGEWLVRLCEERTGGIFNAVGPGERVSFAELLEGCRSGAEPGAPPSTLHWARPEALLEQGVSPWLDLPLWLAKPHVRGMLRVANARAIAAGLRFRPLADTARDTLAWARTRPADHAWQAGLAAEREADVLAALRV